MGFLGKLLVELHTLNPLTNPHNPAILLSPSHTPPLSAVEHCTSELNSGYLFCDGNATVLYGSKQSEGPSVISTSISKNLLSTCTVHPALLFIVFSTETQGGPGLMSFINWWRIEMHWSTSLCHCCRDSDSHYSTNEKLVPLSQLLLYFFSKWRVCTRCASFSIPLKQSVMRSFSKGSTYHCLL